MPNYFSSRTILALTLLLLIIGATATATERPLLMEGKKTLFQRVVSKTGAELFANAGDTAATASLPPFSIQYVYARKESGNQEWLQVAENIRGVNLGWLPADQVIPWNQGLTVTFKNPLERERALLFKNRKSLEKLVEDQDQEKYQKLYKQAVNGSIDADSPVIAIQPNYNIDLSKEFYIAPILEHEDVFFGDGQAKLLKIATVPERIVGSKSSQSEPVQKPVVSKSTAPIATLPKDFSAGIVFVMDATMSMGPYINRTRDAIRKIYKDLDAAGDTGQVRFGLVAFRDNTAEAKGLGYLTKTFATLEQGIDADQFFSVIDQVRPATVSSKDFREDSFAGVKTALEKINWTGIDARYVVLVTDAGPRPPQDQLGSSGLSAEALNKLAESQNISLTVLHLLTPSGVSNHDEAKEQYQTLSRFPGVGALYYGVSAGDVGQFGQAVDVLSSQIRQQVATAAGVAPVEEPPAADTQLAAEAPKNEAQLAGLAGKISQIGNAMRIQYFSKNQESVPSVVSAWTLDHSFSDPQQQTLDVGVLLSRDQLSNLHQRLTKMLSSFQDGLLVPDNFITDLKSVAATLSRDPKQLGADSSDLASMGLMQEYIEDLPYQSDALSISLDDWASWPVARQVHFVHRLEEKLAYYQALYDHTDMWYSPGGGAVTGDSMIALSLDMLP